ncbi:MAG: miaB 2 [Firmicutes bacterium]|nr:miaB 2 [Bacillota bacterium]
MDIVRSVKSTVKIKDFFITPVTGTHVDVLAAIRDTMALFDVNDAGIWQEEAQLNQLRPDSLLVKCAVKSDEDTIEVKVTIDFYNSSAVLNQLTEYERRPLLQENIRNKEVEDITGLIRRLVRLNMLKLMRQIAGHNPGPWGILRGVRPTKIVHKLLDQNVDHSEIVTRLIREYALASAKAELVTGIAVYQRPFIATPDKLAALYKRVYC